MVLEPILKLLAKAESNELKDIQHRQLDDFVIQVVLPNVHTHPHGFTVALNPLKIPLWILSLVKYNQFDASFCSQLYHSPFLCIASHALSI